MARELPRDEEILKIAAEILYRQGHEGTRLDDIARTAGIAKGSLYYYFRSKEEIFERIHANVSSIIDLEQEVSAPGPAPEKLRHLIRQQLVLTAAHPIEVGLCARQLIRLRAPIGQRARRYRDEYREAVRRIILQGQQEGSFREGDPLAMTASVLSFMVQVCDWYRGRIIPPDALVEEMITFILGGLRRY